MIYDLSFERGDDGLRRFTGRVPIGFCIVVVGAGRARAEGRSSGCGMRDAGR